MKFSSHSNRLKLLSLALVTLRIFMMSAFYKTSALCISPCDHEISHTSVLHHTRVLCFPTTRECFAPMVKKKVTFIYQMILGWFYERLLPFEKNNYDDLKHECIFETKILGYQWPSWFDRNALVLICQTPSQKHEIDDLMSPRDRKFDVTTNCINIIRVFLSCKISLNIRNFLLFWS